MVVYFVAQKTGRTCWPCIKYFLTRSFRRTLSAPGFVFAENDFAILRQVNRPDAAPILTKPLKASETLESHLGNVAHAQIIGKSPREKVSTTTGLSLRLHDPTLAEYVALTPRVVTPIYASESNLIVSLLDINAPPRSKEDNAMPLEILEAGTGHGSLTLHIARAIHSWNAHIESAPSTWPDSESVNTMAKETKEQPQKAIDGLHSLRGAVLHTVEISATVSQHAQRIVKGFQRGLYTNNIDFHVCDLSYFLHQQYSQRECSEPFLSAAVLDLPDVHLHLDTVAASLRVDGAIVCFCPSITQIADCVKVVQQRKIPIRLEQAIETGVNTSGGRQWEVRAFRPRARERHRVQLTEAAEEKEVENETDSSTSCARMFHTADAYGGFEMICRPKWGYRLTIGGFLAVFRKIRQD